MADVPVPYIQEISQPSSTEKSAYLVIAIEDLDISIKCAVEISIEDYEDLRRAQNAWQAAKRELYPRPSTATSAHPQVDTS